MGHLKAVTSVILQLSGLLLLIPPLESNWERSKLSVTVVLTAILVGMSGDIIACRFRKTERITYLTACVCMYAVLTLAIQLRLSLCLS